MVIYIKLNNIENEENEDLPALARLMTKEDSEDLPKLNISKLTKSYTQINSNVINLGDLHDNLFQKFFFFSL